MKRIRLICFVTLSILSILSLSVGFSLTQEAMPNDQARLLRQLRSQSADDRTNGLNDLLEMGPEHAEPELRRLLMDLLGESNNLRMQARRRGIATSELQDPQFAANIHHAVVAFRDVQAIPLLAEAMGMFTVVRALADFGEQAVPDVVRVVSAPETDHYAVEDGLRVLRLIMEAAEKKPISAAGRASIVRVTDEKLVGGPHFATLWYAIDLAAVLKDPKYDRILKSLATDQTEVMRRGIEDPKLIEQTMMRAAERLAGIPANPRP